MFWINYLKGEKEKNLLFKKNSLFTIEGLYFQFLFIAPGLQPVNGSFKGIFMATMQHSI